MGKIRILKYWKEVIHTLQNPKDRPNDFQRLVLSAMKNGMTVQDATRVFGQTGQTLFNWRKRYENIETQDDLTYFVVRAHKLGASDEDIAKWFNLQRPDKVAMIIAKSSKAIE